MLVSAGFDAHRLDLVLDVSYAGFAAMAGIVRDIADRHCGGRLLAVLEGGYDVASLGRLAASFLAGVERGCGAAD